MVKFSKAPQRRRRIRKAPKAKPVSVAVKKYVARTLSRTIETKSTSVETETNFGSRVSNQTMNARPIMPYTGYLTIPQGVTQGTRIGNICKVKKVSLNYVLIPLPYNLSTNPNAIPSHVIMYLGRVKQYKGILPEAADVSLLYQLGATTIAPSGTLSDLMFNINTDNWDIKKRWTHKLGSANNQGTGGLASSQYYANNDFSQNIVRRMDITKMCPAMMRFNDSLSTQALDNLFFMFQAVPANGGSTGQYITCNIRYFITIDYEDA